VKVTFIRGRNPELFIRDENGKEVEKIDLSRYTTDDLHKLMVQKGFERKVVGSTTAESQQKTLKSSLVKRKKDAPELVKPTESTSLHSR
jgi:hypothetical protein